MSRKDYEDIITKRVRGAGYCNGNKKYTYLKKRSKNALNIT